MLTNRATLTIEEELFCTRYELETLSGIVNMNMLERWLPGFCSAHTHKEHVSRYDWVKGFVKNKSVLDIACGSGFGSYKIVEEAGALKVIACDIDPATVKYASLRNRHPLIDFQVQNAEAFKLNEKFDVAISFETIEHLENPAAFLSCVNDVLSSDGVFFVSTPISNMQQNNNPANIYHKVEWGFESFHKLISAYFEIENVFLQVYRFPPKPDNRIILRGLRKAGIAKTSNQLLIEKLMPFRWDPKEIDKEIIGSVWSGYQIVKCKKK
jgi:2-polyprenyl-3-methyl-5-hydroxy-6-metoxy-1,4-benzoquinol methylase